VCNECKENLLITGGLCFCPTNYIQTVNGSCVRPNFFECTGKNLYYIDTAECTDTCKEGYYPSGNFCYQCSEGCRECTSDTVCTFCYPDFTESSLQW
jgi:hypothetical protein